MSKFALKEIKELKLTIYPFYRLWVNKKCPYDEAWHKIEKKGFKKELRAIATLIEMVSAEKELTPKQFYVFGKLADNDPYEAFEFRKGRVRIYGFIIPEKGYVLCDGHIKDKKTQESKLARLSEIIQAFSKAH